MSYYVLESDTFEHAGRTFKYEISQDDDIGEPWKWSDGHGPVSDWTTRDKEPGERLLCEDRPHKRYYGFAAAIKQAKSESWGVQIEKTGLTKGQLAVAAVEADFKYLRGWCNDDWSWVCILVTDEYGNVESLGGIESNSTEHIEREKINLANALISRLEVMEVSAANLLRKNNA